MSLSQLPHLHLVALRWFENHCGQIVTNDELTNDMTPCTLTTRAKGIYKPQGSDYVLSVRQGLNSPYSDKDPVYQKDGSWLYYYAQEESGNKPADKLYTNLGLQRCMLDNVPVAVLRQISAKPNTRYHVLGLAHVIDWKDGFFTLQSTTLTPVDTFSPGVRSEETSASPSPFDPANVSDARQKTLRNIAIRQGQPAFRSGLLLAYQGQCAISGCNIKAVLEAAHITPYLGPETNCITNGLLLRSDLHTLWDQGLIHLSDDLHLQLHPSLSASEYQQFANKPLSLPNDRSLAPAPKAIATHREWCLNKER